MSPKNATMLARETVRLDLLSGCGCSGAPASASSIGMSKGPCGCGGECGESGCGCGGSCRGACGTAVTVRERPRWFAGQLVGPRDLTDTQNWILERMRRHNRLMHGWGVDCGLIVKHVVDDAGRPLPWTVQISTGYALAPAGDEILVSCTTTVDVRAGQQAGTGSTPLDPWCAPVGAIRTLSITWRSGTTRR